MDDYDAYVVHASEDERVAALATDRLRERGLAVWFNSFTAGLGLRSQMEDGLRRSTFGVLILSTNLFRKKWAVEELDALLTLEEAGEVRIIPLWLGVTTDEVRSFSPMIAARHAVVAQSQNEDDVRRALDEVVDTVTSLTRDRSPGQWIRAQINHGLTWRRPPGFLPASLRYFDDHYRNGYDLASFSRYPEEPPGESVGEIRPLREFLETVTAWDGAEITAIGHQVEGSLQLLAQHDVVLGEHEGAPVNLASWVFQLHSVEFADAHTAYVHLHGPSGRNLRPDIPHDWLIWVTGVLVAYGSVQTHDGRGANCVYIAARSAHGHPPLGQVGVTPSGSDDTQ